MIDDELLTSTLLQDALSFIDVSEPPDHAVPSEITSSSSFSLSPVASSSPAELPDAMASPKPKRQRRSRKKPAQNPMQRSHGNPKADLERLRLNVNQLETQLAQLKSAREPALQLCSSPGALSTTSSSSDDGSVDSTLVSMWKTVAQRQYQRRKQSEETREKLQQVLAKQIKQAKTLQALLLRRTTQTVSLMMVPGIVLALTLVLDDRIWISSTIRRLRSRISVSPRPSRETTPYRLCC